MRKILYTLLKYKLLRKLFLFLPASYIRVSVNTWEKEYSDGRWDYLRNIDQLSRYSVLSGYIQYYKENGSILDVACGDGILYEKIIQSLYNKYTGIDFSKEAIKKVKKKNNKSSFIHINAIDFVPDCIYDVIIFNECLYYFKKPVVFLAHYEKFLTTNGIFVISMYCSIGTKRIWQKLDKIYSIVDEITISYKTGASCVVKVYRIR